MNFFEQNTANEFAHEWIKAWNNHDNQSILSHYAENIEYQSPFVVRLSGEPSNCLQGIEALRHYVQKGLEAYPDLKFELIGVFRGTNSLVLHYLSVNNLVAAEWMQFDESGKITKLVAHYT